MRAVFLDSSRSTPVPDDIANTASQLIPDLAGVAAETCIAPRDDGAVFLDSSKSTLAPDDVASTSSQLIPDLAGVAAENCIAPCDDGAVLLNCGEGENYGTNNVVDTVSQLIP